jgi:hypothetical protein
VFILIQLSQVADHVAGGIGDNAMSVDSSAAGTVGEDGDGLWTDAVLLVETLHTEEESILRVGKAGRVPDGDGPRSFGEDVLRRRVDERDKGAIAVHAQSAILGDGSQEGTCSQRRRGRFAAFGIDDFGRDVAGSKVSVAITVVSGFKASIITSPSHHTAVRTLPTLANAATPAPNPTLPVSTGRRRS